MPAAKPSRTSMNLSLAASRSGMCLNSASRCNSEVPIHRWSSRSRSVCC
jgi:hypothetical protein